MNFSERFGSFAGEGVIIILTFYPNAKPLNIEEEEGTVTN